jgi:hypothetical protein
MHVSLASAYRNLGNANAEQAHSMRAKDIVERTLGNDHPGLATVEKDVLLKSLVVHSFGKTTPSDTAKVAQTEDDEDVLTRPNHQEPKTSHSVAGVLTQKFTGLLSALTCGWQNENAGPTRRNSDTHVAFKAVSDSDLHARRLGRLPTDSDKSHERLTHEEEVARRIVLSFPAELRDRATREAGGKESWKALTWPERLQEARAHMTWRERIESVGQESEQQQ